MPLPFASYFASPSPELCCLSYVLTVMVFKLSLPRHCLFFSASFTFCTSLFPIYSPTTCTTSQKCSPSINPPQWQSISVMPASLMLERWVWKGGSSWSYWWIFSPPHTNTPHVLTQGFQGKILPSPISSCLILIFPPFFLPPLPCIPHMNFTVLLLFSQVLGLMDCPSVSSSSSLSSCFSLHSAPPCRSAPSPSFFPQLLTQHGNSKSLRLSLSPPYLLITFSFILFIPLHSLSLSLPQRAPSLASSPYLLTLSGQL